MKLRALLWIVGSIAVAIAGTTLARARVTARRPARGPNHALSRNRTSRPLPVLVATPPTRLAPLHVVNTTAATVSVGIWPVLLRQRLDGSFAFSEQPEDLSSAASVVSVDTPRFSLAPGHEQTVGLTWLHGDGPGTYVGLVARGLPAATPQGLPTMSDHLLGIRLFDLPGGRATGRFTQLAAAQGPGSTLHFIPRVLNTGDRVRVPSRATLTILDARHRVVLRKPWHGNVVLPGASRDFIVPVRMKLAPGSYTAVAGMAFGGSQAVESSTHFSLIAPNVLANRAVMLRDLMVRAITGHAARVSLTVSSVGNASSGTTVIVSLYRLGGNAAGAVLGRRRLRLHGIAAGTSRRLAFTLGSRLRHESFRVTVSYHDRPGSESLASNDFTPGERLSLLTRVRRFVKGNTAVSAMIGVILALLSVAASTSVLLRWHRWRAARASAALKTRQRRLAAELAGTAASRERQRRLAAELASTSKSRQRRSTDITALAAAIRREQELAAELEAATIAERRRRRQAAELAVACLAAAKTTRIEQRQRQPA